MKILSTLKSSTCCVNENHSFYIYRADTHQVLARGLDGYEAAKTAANHLRHSLGLKWDQVGFKKETKPTGTNSASVGGNSRSRSTGARYDRSSRYNPSKRGHFRGYYGTDGSYHDIDWRNQQSFGLRGGFWNPLVLWWSLWSSWGPWGLFGGSWRVPLVLVSWKNQKQSQLNPLRGLPTAPLCCSYLLFLLVSMIWTWWVAWWVPRASLRVFENL